METTELKTNEMPDDDLARVIKKTMCAGCISCANMPMHLKGAYAKAAHRMDAQDGDTIKGIKAALSSGKEYLDEVCTNPAEATV